MTNREKFKEIFNKDIEWSRAIQPQILALKSAYINGIDCMEEWLNSEYKSQESEELNMNNQIIQLEAYRLIRIKARDTVESVDDATLGSYVRGVVDLQTELYKLSDEKSESEK